jgi:hypothetical protein
VPGFLKDSRTLVIIGATVAAIALGAVLRVLGLLVTAGQLIGYSTTLLAVASVGLAAGVVGSYAELREASRRQAEQLSKGSEADLAQVEIERFSGPGELVRINVRNGSQRAIRNIYVWADVQNVTGHYAAGLPADDPLSRRMVNVPHDEGLQWRLRVIHPGRQAFFTQLVHLNPHPLPAVADASITAFAEFTDTAGTWWRCDEDGIVTRREIAEPATPDQPDPARPRALPLGPDRSFGPATGPTTSPQPRVAGLMAPGSPPPQRPAWQQPPHYSDVP